MHILRSNNAISPEKQFKFLRTSPVCRRRKYSWQRLLFIFSRPRNVCMCSKTVVSALAVDSRKRQGLADSLALSAFEGARALMEKRPAHSVFK